MTINMGWRRFTSASPFSLSGLHAAVLIAALALSGCGGSGVSEPPVTTGRTTATTIDGLRYDLQGHRGARGLKPENTLPAFETALDLGVSTLELDLHFSSDQQVVVWHDPVIDSAKCRVPGGVAVDGLISASSADSLATLICDGNPDPARFPDQNAEPTELAGDAWGIVTLDQLFDFVEQYAQSDLKSTDQRAGASVVRFNIETKRVPDDPTAIGDDFDGVAPGAFELAILELIERRGMAERTTIQSFDHRSLWAIRTVSPDQKLAALTRRGEVPDFVELAENGAAIWSPTQSAVTESRVVEAHDAGLLVIPWTVNEVDEMTALLDMGVDGLITDRPDLAPPSR